MGTRNLIMAIVDNEVKVAQYGQWDGYPQGQGAGICEFIEQLVGEDRIEEFANKLRECSFYAEKEVRDIWEDHGADRNDKYVSTSIADEVDGKYPEISRDTGSDILKLIDDGVRKLQDSREFAGQSLFCEFAYVVNFDTQCIEVYTGFNKEPLKPTERFHDYNFEQMQEGRTQYYQVKHWQTFPFKTPYLLQTMLDRWEEQVEIDDALYEYRNNTPQKNLEEFMEFMNKKITTYDMQAEMCMEQERPHEANTFIERKLSLMEAKDWLKSNVMQS